ncbi:MAG TPA: hypothetical protein VEX70_13325 [Pyrinomonadaceae bacterium]|nr:hypothetical protein [Pyrinomonadaceae bacterium]
MKKQKKVETPEEKEARMWTLFNKLLNAANSQTASPVAVKAFRDVVEDCRKAGFNFWREKRVRNPLEAALFVVVDVDAPKLMGGAIPTIWQQQAIDFLSDSGHDDAPMMEQTLIEHAAVCWVRLAVMEVYYSAAHRATGNSIKWLEFTEKRLILAQRRYARAVETLSRFRMMAEATRLLEARADAAGAARRVNNMRTLKAVTA